MAHYAVTLAAEQKRRGHRVAVWGKDGSPVLAAAAEAGVETRGYGGPGDWPGLRGAAARFAPRVINAHTGSAHTLALFLAAGSPAVVVRTRGDARPARGNPLTRLVAGRTAAFIAANSALADSLAAAFPGAKVRLVPQGIAGPEKTASLPSWPIAGIVARLDPVKGHETAFEAVSLSKDNIPNLRLACAGEGRLQQDLQRSATRTGRRGLVELSGRAEDKWAYMATCRIGLVPSLGSEAVSRAALEWMAAGRAVIASRVGGLPDLVEDGVTGLLVPPGDAKALASALETILTDSAKAEAMGRAGRARWSEKFGLAPFYENTQKVYDEAASHLAS